MRQYDSDKHVANVRVARRIDDVGDEENGDSGSVVSDGVEGVEIVDWRDRVIAWTRSHGPFSYRDWHDRVLNTDHAGRFTAFDVELDLRKP